MTQLTAPATTIATSSRPTIGIDLGDRTSHYCILDREGHAQHGKVKTTEEDLTEFLKGQEPSLVVVEVSTHSPWISRLVRNLGHECLVADSRRLPLISKSNNKCDPVDAESLARLARADSKLLNPITHRHERAQADLAVMRSRSALVKARTQLVNHVRGTVKSVGRRIPAGIGSACFHRKARPFIPQELEPALLPVLRTLEELTEQIKNHDGQIESLCQERYPETGVMRQIGGVGAIVALYFALVLCDPKRFPRSRCVGPFLGMVPRRSSSGSIDPQLGITKAGDRELRRLLVLAANYVLGRGPDCDLKRWGAQIAARGGKNAKKRAKVAVARKLAVLMHHLWVTGEEYDPFYQAKRRGEDLPDAA